MTKRELEKRKEMLLRELHKEEQKKHVAEQNLSLYEYKKEEVKAKTLAPKKSTAPKKSKSAKKAAVKSIKPAKQAPVKKEERASLSNKKKHVIVTLKEFRDYDFDQRKKDWHLKSGINSKQEICSLCKDDDNWETILLENGNHVCYYCWIKKPVDQKSDSKSKDDNDSKKETTKPIVVKKESKKEEKVTESAKSKAEPKSIDSKAEEKALVKSSNENKKSNSSQPGKLFYIISILLGLLLIGLIVVLALGIISGNFDFNFKN